MQHIYNISSDAQHVCKEIPSLDLVEVVELWGLADEVLLIIFASVKLLFLTNKFGYDVANLLEEITKPGVTSIEHSIFVFAGHKLLWLLTNELGCSMADLLRKSKTTKGVTSIELRIIVFARMGRDPMIGSVDW